MNRTADFEEELFWDGGDLEEDLHHVAEPRSQGSSEPDYAVGAPAPPPNSGQTGSIHHWRLVERIAQDLQRRGFTDIRVDQQQVAGGRIIGENRPDIQAVSPTGQHVIYEVDTQPEQRQLHQRVVSGLLRQHDPNSQAIFVQIDPRTGAIQRQHVYDTRTQRWATRHGGTTWHVPHMRMRQPALRRRAPAQRAQRGRRSANQFLGL